MKRTYIIYIAVVAGLILVGVLWIALALHDNNTPVLRKLGKGEREFREARNELVYNTTDAASVLVKYVTRKKNPVRGRVQALTILKEIAVHQDLADQGKLIAPLLTEGNRSLSIACMQTLAALITLDGAELVAPFLADPDTAVANAAMRALTGSALALRARLQTAIRAGNRAGVDSCVAIAQSLTLPKDDIYSMASGYLGRTGDTIAAAQAHAARGVLSQWMICGGFGISGWDRVDQVQPPDTTAYNKTSTYQGIGGAVVSWLPFTFQFDEWGNIWGNIWNSIEHKAPAVAFLSCFVSVAQDRDALLFVWSMDAITIQANGNVLLKTLSPGIHPDIGEWCRIPLRKGTNRIVLKLGRMEYSEDQEAGWPIYARLTDSRGEAMTDAVITAEPPPVQAEGQGMPGR